MRPTYIGSMRGHGLFWGREKVILQQEKQTIKGLF